MNRIFLTLASLLVALQSVAAGWPANYGGVMLQGFYWDSFGESKWSVLTSQADELSKYFNLIWVPQSGNCQNTNMGYSPVWWFDHNSSFGTTAELRTMINTFKSKGTGIIEDVVINHRNGKSNWCDFPTETWKGNTMSWTLADICRNDECAYNGYSPTGNYDTGDNFDGARDLDHTSANVQKNVKLYLDFLLNDLGYVGFRYDMVKGYDPKYTKLYNESAQPEFSVGEYWDGSYSAVKGWISGTGYNSAAFDFPLKYVINNAFGNSNWGALSDKGIAGDPNNNRYAVTFIDNHDTYRNNDKLSNNVLAANAFILGLPGTPCIMLPHWKTYKTEIGNMILARKAAGITNQSSITEQGTQGGGYVMKVQGSVGTVMVIVGYVANANTTGFKLVSTGENYAYFVSDNVDISGTTPPDEPKDITVHINAAKAPYLYVWSGSSNILSSVWPGDKLSQTTTTADGKVWYTATFNAANINLVVNDGAGVQTTDISGVSSDIYLIFNSDGSYQDVTSAYDSNATTTLPECAQYIDGHLFCYFEGNSTYSSPNAWIWNDEGSFTGSAWPGTALTEVGSAQNGNKVWLWDGGELPASLPTGVVFNTGTGTPKTIDLEFVNAGYYTPNGLVDVVKKADTLKGDINGDGKVDVSDVTTLVGYILDGETPQNCDLDGDGSVNVTDVTTLVNLILG